LADFILVDIKCPSTIGHKFNKFFRNDSAYGCLEAAAASNLANEEVVEAEVTFRILEQSPSHRKIRQYK
jgi:hypothetical protein